MNFVFISILVCFSVAKRRPVFEKFQLLEMDKNYGTARMSAKRYNRTTFLMNVEMNITKTLPADTLIKLDVYKHSENVYKKTALTYERNFCDFITPTQKKYFFDSEDVTKQMTFAPRCPVKGYYWVKDLDPVALMDCSFFSFLPLWQAKIMTTMGPKNHPIMISEIYFEVVESF